MKLTTCLLLACLAVVSINAAVLKPAKDIVEVTEILKKLKSKTEAMLKTLPDSVMLPSFALNMSEIDSVIPILHLKGMLTLNGVVVSGLSNIAYTSNISTNAQDTITFRSEYNITEINISGYYGVSISSGKNNITGAGRFEIKSSNLRFIQFGNLTINYDTDEAQFSSLNSSVDFSSLLLRADGLRINRQLVSWVDVNDEIRLNKSEGLKFFQEQIAPLMKLKMNEILAMTPWSTIVATLKYIDFISNE